MTNGLSFTEVSEILALIERIDCETLTVEYGDLKISVGRGKTASLSGDGDLADDLAQAAPPMQVVQPAQPAPPAPPAQPAPPAEAEFTPAHWVSVTAPMVGTFYRSEAPDKPPFVEVGDRVQAGQTLGLIEVMKLYSDLKADVEGTVARVDAAHGQLVEYDEPLLWIEPVS